jgi:hypothetical protein
VAKSTFPGPIGRPARREGEISELEHRGGGKLSDILAMPRSTPANPRAVPKYGYSRFGKIGFTVKLSVGILAPLYCTGLSAPATLDLV